MFAGYEFDAYKPMIETWAGQLNYALEHPDKYNAESKTHDGGDGLHIEDTYDAIILQYVTDLYDWGSTLAIAKATKNNTMNDTNLLIHDALRYGHNMWEYTTTICRPLTLCGFLIIMNSLTMYNANDLYQLVGDESTKAILELGEGAFQDDIPNDDLTFKMPSDEEIQKALEGCDENILKEFFNTFRELKTFKMDQDEYQSDKQKQLHSKLMGLYQKIMGTI